jgi:predicted ATPase
MYGFKMNNSWFKWDELSYGTRRIAWIVLNVLLIHKEVILIEKTELGIHPAQLARLMDFIKDQSAHKQIIITTHSPEVLDILESDELDRIKIARYDEARGTTVIEGLSDKKIALIQKYIQKTSLLSNYWSNIGLENTKKSF